jgi:hypothetical protein
MLTFLLVRNKLLCEEKKFFNYFTYSWQLKTSWLWWNGSLLLGHALSGRDKQAAGL